MAPGLVSTGMGDRLSSGPGIEYKNFTVETVISPPSLLGF